MGSRCLAVCRLIYRCANRWTQALHLYLRSRKAKAPACTGILPVKLQRALPGRRRSEEHTSELQSPDHLECRLLLATKTMCQIRHYTSIANIKHAKSTRADRTI